MLKWGWLFGSALVILMSLTRTASAADFYVMAGARESGDGSKQRPFSRLAEAETASVAGDRVYVSARSPSDVLEASIVLKPNQKLIGLAPGGGAPRYEAEMPQLTSSVVEQAVYDMPYNNGAYKPTTSIVKLARGVEVAGIHFVNMKGPALLAGDQDISGARIHNNVFSGVMPKSSSMIYSIVLGGSVSVSDVRVIDNSFRDGVTLGGIVVQQRGDSVGAYYFQRNDFRDLGGRAYFTHSEDTSTIVSTILDSTANNIGLPPDGPVPGAGNADSVIPYLTGRSHQRVLVKNFRFKNDKQVGGLSNTGVEVFIYGMRSQEDKANWCVGCTAEIDIQDSVFEHPVTDGIQVANYGNGSIVSLAVRRTKIIGATPRQTGGAISMMAQREGNKGSKISLLVEDSELVGSKAYAFANTNESGESVATIDMGGGALGSKGRNIIAGNLQGVFKLQGERVSARNNFWGDVAPEFGAATVDASSPLRRSPSHAR